MPKIIPSKAECILWFQNKRINPITNRNIKVDGPVYNNYYKYGKYLLHSKTKRSRKNRRDNTRK